VAEAAPFAFAREHCNGAAQGCSRFERLRCSKATELGNRPFIVGAARTHVPDRKAKGAEKKWIKSQVPQRPAASMTWKVCRMTMRKAAKQNLIDSLEQMSAPELRRLLAEHLTRQKLGLHWERDAIEHDRMLNADVVLPRLVPEWSHTPEGCSEHRNLIIEGDNFDSLRLLRSTHAGKVRVIYIDPPYNTGNKDWVYNDNYVGANDRWRHSQWLEFLFQRLTLARELLSADGVIMVSINDENRARLEMLMDEVFPGRRLGTIVWRTRQGSNADQQCFLSVDHEHILVYGNSGFAFKGFDKSYEMYSNPMVIRGAIGGRITSRLVSPTRSVQTSITHWSMRRPVFTTLQTRIGFGCTPAKHD
jgi:adenine-specific DNA-methyltransferase